MGGRTAPNEISGSLARAALDRDICGAGIFYRIKMLKPP
jgi:hypothetical protein